jgi:hypothetical protein
MQTCGALVEGEWSDSRPGSFTLGTHWIRGWVEPTAGLEGILFFLETQLICKL